MKHLVEQHGGQIAASSEGAGCGSSFTITLPLFQPDSASHDRPNSTMVDRSLLAGVRVLVVDDEADARATLRDLLEQFGALPTVAASASEAFSVVRQSPPDVLLSDIAMPDEEDGYALLRRIRRSIDAAHLPAAALSGRLDREAQSHAADAGFQECLAKPIDPTVLAQALARLVHRGIESHVL